MIHGQICDRLSFTYASFCAVLRGEPGTHHLRQIVDAEKRAVFHGFPDVNEARR